MHPLSRFAAAALALLPALAAAQDQGRPDPLDAAHAVPQLSYQSVFERYQAGKDETETPEKRWIGINRQLMPQPKAKATQAAPPAVPAQGGGQHMHGGQQHAQ